jgi:hypothetical protein
MLNTLQYNKVMFKLNLQSELQKRVIFCNFLYQWIYNFENN